MPDLLHDRWQEGIWWEARSLVEKISVWSGNRFVVCLFPSATRHYSFVGDGRLKVHLLWPQKCISLCYITSRCSPPPPPPQHSPSSKLITFPRLPTSNRLFPPRVSLLTPVDSIPDFITEEEEEYLIRKIGQSPQPKWKTVGTGRRWNISIYSVVLPCWPDISIRLQYWGL